MTRPCAAPFFREIRYVQKILQHKEKATAQIAHRLSTLTGADVIVVMGEGRIVELGRTSTSWRRRGLYPEMVERQRQSFGEAVDVA
jgi:ATP-binding cassette subfamily B protein